MCRMLGMISEKPSDIGYYFFDADKPFKDFSKDYPHGWGLGWYEGGEAKIFKQGLDDVPIQNYDFSKVREAASNITIAHVRGTKRSKNYSTDNAQPFKCKNWVFAHNGGLERKPLLDHLTEDFKKRLRGDADSEVYFLHIMQNYESCNDIVAATRSTLKVVREDDYSGLNFLLTDGKKIYAFRDASRDKDFFSLHYTTPGHDKDNRSVVFSSEPLTKNEVWNKVDLGQMVIVGNDLKIKKIMLGGN